MGTHKTLHVSKNREVEIIINVRAPVKSVFAFISLLLMIFLISPLILTGCGGQSGDAEPQARDNVYVVFKNDVGQAQAEEIIDRLGYTANIGYLIGDPLKASITPPPDKSTDEIIEEFQAEPQVLLATTDFSVVSEVPPNIHYIPGEIEVSFYAHATDEQIREVVARHNCTGGDIHRGSDLAVLHIRLPEGKDEDQAVEEFKKEPLVKQAQREALFIMDL